MRDSKESMIKRKPKHHLNEINQKESDSKNAQCKNELDILNGKENRP